MNEIDVTIAVTVVTVVVAENLYATVEKDNHIHLVVIIDSLVTYLKKSIYLLIFIKLLLHIRLRNVEYIHGCFLKLRNRFDCLNLPSDAKGK